MPISGSISGESDLRSFCSWANEGMNSEDTDQERKSRPATVSPPPGRCLKRRRKQEQGHFRERQQRWVMRSRGEGSDVAGVRVCEVRHGMRGKKEDDHRWSWVPCREFIHSFIWHVCTYCEPGLSTVWRIWRWVCINSFPSKGLVG